MECGTKLVSDAAQMCLLPERAYFCSVQAAICQQAGAKRKDGNLVVFFEMRQGVWGARLPAILTRQKSRQASAPQGS